jgi:hypothetical protein
MTGIISAGHPGHATALSLGKLAVIFEKANKTWWPLKNI